MSTDKLVVLLAAPLVLLPAGDTAAQEGVHTDVYVFDDNGTLSVGGFGCPDTACGSGTVLADQRVFSEVLNQFAIERGPGYRALGGDLPVSTDIDWDFLPLTVDSGPNVGHTSTLLYWDGVGSEAQFGPPPTPDYALAYLGRDNAFALAGSEEEIVPGKTVFRTTGNGATHTHGTYQLDADGDIFTLDTPADGVYAFSMRLRADGLEASDPYFLVFRTENSALAPALPIASAWVEERVDTLFIDGLPGDFNGDGSVDAADFVVWQTDFEAGLVAASQYGLWAANFGDSSTSFSASVPEPSTVWLLPAVASLVRRRR